MATDGSVLVNDTGTKKVDTTEVTRADGTIVERQRAQLAGSDAGAVIATALREPDEAGYGLPTRSVDAGSTSALLLLIWQELQLMNRQLLISGTLR